jgi:hypothetical protein
MRRRIGAPPTAPPTSTALPAPLSMATKPPTPETTKPKGSGSERRRWNRADADLAVTVSLSGGRSEARLRDISRAGICFFLDRPIPLMTVLELSVNLPVQAGVRRIGGHGAVVRCEKIAKRVDHYEVAVFLHEMAEADRRVIEEFVAT